MRRTSSAALATVLAAVAFTATALPAEAAGARHTFASPSPSYEHTTSHGTFNAQVKASWTSSKPVTMAWSFRTSPRVRSIATGPMTCRAGHRQLRYSDYHPNIGVTYIWHSSVPNNKRNTNYDMWGYCTFPVKAGGKPGLATLKFDFSYRVAGPATTRRAVSAPTAEQGETSFTTELTIS